jgi:hypothetical protein
LEISCTAVEFVSDRDEVLLVIDEIGLTEELRFRQCDLPTMRKLRAPTNLRVQFLNIDALSASCQVDPYPDNGHVRRGIYDNSCWVAPGYKYPPYNHLLVGCSKREIDTCHLRATLPLMTL